MGRRLSQKAPYRRLRARLIQEAGACRACGATDDLTLDHIQPMSMGGAHNESNLQVLCRSCNVKKKQTTIHYVGAAIAS